MEIIEYTLIVILFVMIISLLYSGSVVPFYRLFNFGKKIAYIKSNKTAHRNKLIKIAGYILLAVAVVYFLKCSIDAYYTRKDFITDAQNYETILAALLSSFKYIIFVIIIIGSIPRSIKESIYERGIKTDSAFIKWSEINEIKIDDKENRLLIYYKLRTIFFIKTNDSYIIEDYSYDNKNLIYDYWNKEKTKIQLD